MHIIFTACRLHYKGHQQPACAIFTTQNTCQSHVGQPRCGPHVPFRSAERHVLRCQTGRFALPNGTNAAALWPVARQRLATAYRTARCHPVSKPYFFTVNIFHVFLFSLSLHTIKLHSAISEQVHIALVCIILAYDKAALGRLRASSLSARLHYPCIRQSCTRKCEGKPERRLNALWRPME